MRHAVGRPTEARKDVLRRARPARRCHRSYNQQSHNRLRRAEAGGPPLGPRTGRREAITFPIGQGLVPFGRIAPHTVAVESPGAGE